MARFYICLLCLANLLGIPAVSAASGNAGHTPPPMDAASFLNSLNPSSPLSGLYDFFDIYAAEFAACRQIPALLKGLGYMADNGENGFVRARLQRLASCRGLPKDVALAADALAVKVSSPARFSEPEPTALAAVPDAAPDAAPPQTAPSSPSGVGSDASPAAEKRSAAYKEPAKSPGAPGKKLATGVGGKARTEARAPGVGRSELKAKRPEPKTPAQAVVITPPSLVRTALTERRPLTALVEMPPELPPEERDKKQVPGKKTKASFTNNNVYRDGDPGTSRFYRNESILSMAYGNLQLSAAAVHLTSFSEKSDTESGSSYLKQKTDTLHTKDTVLVPQAVYTLDDLTFTLGMSPIGGTVAPLPTGGIKFTRPKYSLAVAHDVVTDSLLSYVGFTDVYTGKRMGRVMKAWGKASWQDTFAQHWFYGATASGAYLYGENVKDNTGVKGEAYLGRSFGPLAIGVYASADHFARDLNHFTYGHGGYYSPYLAAAGSCFISWEYKGENLYVKLDTGFGYLYEEQRSSDRYYGGSGWGEPYAGEYNDRFTTNSGLELRYSLNKNLNIKGSARLLTSYTFYEARGDFGLEMTF